MSGGGRLPFDLVRGARFSLPTTTVRGGLHWLHCGDIQRGHDWCCSSFSPLLAHSPLPLSHPPWSIGQAFGPGTTVKEGASRQRALSCPPNLLSRRQPTRSSFPLCISLSLLLLYTIVWFCSSSLCFLSPPPTASAVQPPPTPVRYQEVIPFALALKPLYCDHLHTAPSCAIAGSAALAVKFLSLILSLLLIRVSRF